MEEKKVTWLELFYDLLFVAAATHVLLHVEKGYIHPEYKRTIFPKWSCNLTLVILIDKQSNDGRLIYPWKE